MARRVLADFRTEVILRCANRTDLTDTMAGIFVQDAYLAICNQFEHQELKAHDLTTFTIGQDYTNASSLMWWPELLTNYTEGYTIDLANIEDIEGQIKQSGMPHRFHWRYYPTVGNRFYWDSKPTYAYNLLYWFVRKPAEFTGSPEIDQIFDPVIVMKAASLALSTFRDLAEAHIVDVEMNNYISDHRLPLRQGKLMDHNTGVKVRFR